jgi:hypothetical protein
LLVQINRSNFTALMQPSLNRKGMRQLFSKQG